MEIYGYIRVSSADQNEDRQLTAMNGLQVPQSNIHIIGNDLLNKAPIIFLKLENVHRIDNIHIEDNVNLTGIELRHSRGSTSGANLYARNNTGSGTIQVGAQCIIENNVGFTEKKRR